MYTMPKTLITLMLLVFTAAFATAPMAGNDNSSRATPMKFVGTFYAPAGRTISYHSDGTLSVVNATMFNGDDELADRRTTPFLGVWRKVDDNKIQATALFFTTEAFGDNYSPDGFILKSTWLATYDDMVRGVSPGYNVVDIETEVFFPDQNPITDDPIQVSVIPGGRADRLTAE
jgi:hypothetical protein